MARLSRQSFLGTRGGCDQLGSYRVTGDVLRCKGYVTSTTGRVARAGDVAVTAGHGRGRDVACCVGGGHVTGDGVAGAAGLRREGGENCQAADEGHEGRQRAAANLRRPEAVLHVSRGATDDRAGRKRRSAGLKRFDCPVGLLAHGARGSLSSRGHTFLTCGIDGQDPGKLKSCPHGAKNWRPITGSQAKLQQTAYRSRKVIRPLVRS